MYENTFSTRNLLVEYIETPLSGNRTLQRSFFYSSNCVKTDLNLDYIPTLKKRLSEPLLKNVRYILLILFKCSSFILFGDSLSTYNFLLFCHTTLIDIVERYIKFSLLYWLTNTLA